MESLAADPGPWEARSWRTPRPASLNSLGARHTFFAFAGTVFIPPYLYINYFFKLFDYKIYVDLEAYMPKGRDADTARRGRGRARSSSATGRRGGPRSTSASSASSAGYPPLPEPGPRRRDDRETGLESARPARREQQGSVRRQPAQQLQQRQSQRQQPEQQRESNKVAVRLWVCACGYENFPGRFECHLCRRRRPQAPRFVTQDWLQDKLPLPYWEHLRQNQAGGLRHGAGIQQIRGSQQPQPPTRRVPGLRPPPATGKPPPPAPPSQPRAGQRGQAVSSGAADQAKPKSDVRKGTDGEGEGMHGDGGDDRDGGGFTVVKKRAEKRKAAKARAAAGGDVRRTRGDERQGGEEAIGDGDEAQGGCHDVGDADGLAEKTIPKPFAPPPVHRKWLIAQKAALERKVEALRGRKAAERRIECVQALLQETNKQIKDAGGATFQKVSFQILDERKRTRKAEQELQRAKGELQEAQDELERARKRIYEKEVGVAAAEQKKANSEARTAHLVAQLASETNQSGMEQVHNALHALGSAAPPEYRGWVDILASYVQSVSPMYAPVDEEVLLAGLGDTDSDMDEEEGDEDDDSNKTNLDHESEPEERDKTGAMGMQAPEETAVGDVRVLKRQRLTAIRAGAADSVSKLDQRIRDTINAGKRAAADLPVLHGSIPLALHTDAVHAKSSHDPASDGSRRDSTEAGPAATAASSSSAGAAVPAAAEGDQQQRRAPPSRQQLDAAKEVERVHQVLQAAAPHDYCLACGDGPHPPGYFVGSCECGGYVCFECDGANQCQRCLQPTATRRARRTMQEMESILRQRIQQFESSGAGGGDSYTMRDSRKRAASSEAPRSRGQ